MPDRIAPPPGLSSDQIGFIDVINDQDSHLRRVLLGMPCPDSQSVSSDSKVICDSEKYQFSLIIRLAEIYLAEAGITLTTGIRDRPDRILLVSC
ncbi:MAG TPA: hypothetical protein ACFCUY_12820 [Xenococcaceae cyanobacterium]